MITSHRRYCNCHTIWNSIPPPSHSYAASASAINLFSNTASRIRIRIQTPHKIKHKHPRPLASTTCCCALEDNTIFPDDNGDSEEDEASSIRENLERIVGKDDSSFSGIDLATLIRNKYGRSYDVQLIKKEFMGRNLLAMNVMWKYREQRSFPLTEEEYILRLDDVANNLRCWGAVSHIRNSLQNSKERPRIGKAVSIFIDMDESGGRANEWIYK
ncbi:hypothetical protein UlMin_020064 [Ulmus minor]